MLRQEGVGGLHQCPRRDRRSVGKRGAQPPRPDRRIGRTTVSLTDTSLRLRAVRGLMCPVARLS